MAIVLQIALPLLDANEPRGALSQPPAPAVCPGSLSRDVREHRINQSIAVTIPPDDDFSLARHRLDERATRLGIQLGECGHGSRRPEHRQLHEAVG